MTERDPHNGYAWYSLGDSIWRQARRQLSERGRLARALVPDSKRMDELNTQIKELGDKAVECFLHAQDTGRFRIIAGQRIAEIYSIQGEKKKAVEMLVKCYDDGMTLRIRLEAPIILTGLAALSVLTQKNFLAPPALANSSSCFVRKTLTSISRISGTGLSRSAHA